MNQRELFKVLIAAPICASLKPELIPEPLQFWEPEKEFFYLKPRFNAYISNLSVPDGY